MPSLSTGASYDARGIREPWYIRLLRPVQDRGSI
jgi:hypothetical protein